MASTAPSDKSDPSGVGAREATARRRVDEHEIKYLCELRTRARTNGAVTIAAAAMRASEGVTEEGSNSSGSPPQSSDED